MEMSETELNRRGSVTKQTLIQAIMELKKQKAAMTKPEHPDNIIALVDDMLTKRLNPCTEQFSQLLQKLNDLTDKVKTLQTQYDDLKTKSTSLNEGYLDNVMWEAEERYRRRKYIIVSGLPEDETGTVSERLISDTNKVKNLALSIGFQGFEPREISRIGNLNSLRPRLLRLKWENPQQRNALLHKARSLRQTLCFKDVYLKPDQTRMQREQSQRLRAELKSRRDSGEKAIIRRGQIVNIDDHEENFRIGFYQAK